MSSARSIILLEGPIGVGKTSTMLQLHSLAPAWDTYMEPLKEWQTFPAAEGGSVDLLDAYYRNPCSTNLRQLQHEINNSMMKRYFLSAKTGTSPVAIFERSMKVAAEVFIEDTGDQLDPIDRQLLIDQCQLGADTYESDATHVYLSCTDKEMLDRVHGRGRKSERHLSAYRLVEMKRSMDEWAARNKYYTISTSFLNAAEVAAEIVEWFRRINP